MTQFSKRYYTNELIKGVVLFTAIGLLYFLLTIFIEHFWWLNTVHRTILFWLFIIVELGLLYKFIGIPVFKLLGIKNGLSHDEASAIIGNHFPEVNDKLLNLLQLKKSNTQSELLLASIDQKAKKLSPIPFSLAINFKDNLKYTKYLFIPFIIILLVQFTGNQSIISNSYNRVINHNIAYAPPAPFSFVIKNKKLQAFENQSYKIQVTTNGKVVPENLKITFNNETYYLKVIDFNTYEYEFTQLHKPIVFNLSADEVTSPEYTLDVIAVPSILNFKTFLQFPKYIKKKDEVSVNNGNLTVPEGTKINWYLIAKDTDIITYSTKDTLVNFIKADSNFSFKKQFFKSENYQLSTTNTKVTNYEKLNYTIQVIKDEYPDITVQSKSDSINAKIVYFLGKISDDYGFSKLQLVYKNVNDGIVYIKKLPLSKSNFQQFTFTFPGNLNIKKSGTYEYYFEVFDNDNIHKFKKARSQVFTYQKLSDSQQEEELIKNQQESITNLKESLKQLSKQEKALKEFDIIQKEKKSLNWNDKNKLKQFIQRQQQQEGLMKKFNKNLQRNLEEFQKEDVVEDPFKEALKERLKEQEKKLEENDDLLEQLKELQDKLKDEELFSKIEKLSKESKNQERSLEQILELTKRFYVAKKFEKLAQDLEDIAKKQEELSNKAGEANTKDKQDSLTKQFDNFKKDLDALQKENKDLKRPMPLNTEKEAENDISKEQQKASENLKKQEQQKAKNSQKKAAQKMNEMSMKMQQSMQSASSEQLEEDEKMLRQILDNLITYSFDQEALLESFKTSNNFNTDFAIKLKKQYILKDHFAHIDDSLFALSLRVPKLSDVINNEISDVYFNINKALERFADQKIYMGISNQQYALTASNNLANLLSDILKNMQEQLNQQNQPGAGQCNKPGGQGKGFQLSDIIKKQGELNNKMKDGLAKQKGGQDKNGKDQKGTTGNSDEEGLGELFKIFKEQQQLKNHLQKLLKDSKGNSNSKQLISEMESIENKLLDQGFNKSLLEQMNKLKHELLKLDEASFEQGQDSKRNSSTNLKDFNNPVKNKLPSIEQYFNEIEILNRHALPLQPIYKTKVKQYFSISND